MKRIDMIHAVAGLMILISVLLTKYNHPNWLYLNAFVGLNLFQYGFSQFCPLEKILVKLKMGKN